MYYTGIKIQCSGLVKFRNLFSGSHLQCTAYGFLFRLIPSCVKFSRARNMSIHHTFYNRLVCRYVYNLKRTFLKRKQPT